MTRSEEAGEEAKIDEEVIGKVKDRYVTMFTTYVVFLSKSTISIVPCQSSWQLLTLEIPF